MLKSPNKQYLYYVSTFMRALMEGGADGHSPPPYIYRCGRTFWGEFGVETSWVWASDLLTQP
jgi:hypothetical protein